MAGGVDRSPEAEAARLQRRRALAAQGLTCKQAAAREGVKYISMHNYARVRGIRFVSGGKRGPRRIEIGAAEVAQIAAIYAAGASLNETAERAGYSVPTIRRAFRAHGVPICARFTPRART